VCVLLLAFGAPLVNTTNASQDFELGSRKALLEAFPNDAEIIAKLTEGLP
jgi:hypothetical protein